MQKSSLLKHNIMEGFEPSPKTIAVETVPQAEDTAAVVEELLKNEDLSPAHAEQTRRETSGLMTRLGKSPLARKIILGVTALSFMAAKEIVSPQEVAAQVNAPAVRAEAGGKADSAIRNLEKQLDALKQSTIAREAKLKGMETLEATAKEFSFELGAKLGKVEMFGIRESDIDVAYFKNQRQALAEKIKQLEDTYASLGSGWRGHVLDYLQGTLTRLDKLLAYVDANGEKLRKAGELRKAIQSITGRWQKGEWPYAGEKDVVAKALEVLKATQNELEQAIKP